MTSRLLLIFVLVGLTLVACSDDDENGDAPLTDAGYDDVAAVGQDVDEDVAEDVGDDELAQCELFDEHGPFEVGVIDIADGELEAAIFYPATDEAGEMARFSYDLRQWLPEDDRDTIPDDDAPHFEVNAAVDAEAAPGPFPVVLFSHGLAGYRYQSSTLLAHLASWGFVVASAEHVERNLGRIVGELTPDGDNAAETLRTLVDYLDDAHDDASHQLAGRLDLGRVAATGHSMGGAGAVSMVGEPGVQAGIFYASGPNLAADQERLDARLLWMAGSTDRIIPPSTIEGAYELEEAPKSYLEILQAGHLAFSDICAIGADQGGILQIAVDAGIEVNPLLLQLGNDGCRDTDLPVEDAWPIIHHYSVAHLRHSFGLDDEPTGLDEEVPECFAHLTEVTWRAGD